ncbi:hypothetical protein AURDEDRAFT_176981, partial [Auricularia subglabra TFB-10046 SS5]
MPFNLALVSPPAEHRLVVCTQPSISSACGAHRATRRLRRLGSSSGAKHGSTGAVLSPAAGKSLLLIHFFFRLRRATDTVVRGSEIASQPALLRRFFRLRRHRTTSTHPSRTDSSIRPAPASPAIARLFFRLRRAILLYSQFFSRLRRTTQRAGRLAAGAFNSLSFRLRRAAPTILYATRLALFVALASASVLVERHTPSSCSGAAADSTRKCTVKSGECCPADWSCVVPADGTEVCLQNARSSACPAGYAVKNNVCVLSGTPVTSGVASTATGGNSAVTSVIAVTTTSLSTSFSTSGSATIAVTVPVPITTSATTILVPTTTAVPSVSVSHSLSTSGGSTFTVPVNVTLTSAATDTASLSVSTSFSQSGSATVP